LTTVQCIAWNGRILVIGFAAGDIEKVPANLVLLKQCTLMGVFWGLNTCVACRFASHDSLC
jgi:NADPH2:quinone reductase